MFTVAPALPLVFYAYTGSTCNDIICNVQQTRIGYNSPLRLPEDKIESKRRSNKKTKTHIQDNCCNERH